MVWYGFFCGIIVGFCTSYILRQIFIKPQVSLVSNPEPTIELVEHENYKKFCKRVNEKDYNDKGKRLYVNYMNDFGQSCMFFGAGLKGCTVANKVKLGGYYEESATFMSWKSIEEEFSNLKCCSPRVVKSTDLDLARKAELWDAANKELEDVVGTLTC